jgi:alcohol dehydrogenase class IV
MFFNNFKVPKDIIFGWDSIEYLDQIQGKKAAVISDKAFKNYGFVNKAIKSIESAGMSCQTITSVEEEPTFDMVLNKVSDLQDFSPDIIVAIGGGSVIDVAKALRIFYEAPDFELQDLLRPFNLPKTCKSRLIAIPSTSGTGSEVTRVSMLINSETRLKQPIISYDLIPEMAIIDPQITLTMPKSVTSNSGFDALTHAIESYNCKIASEFTKALAARSIQLIFKYLPIAYSDGDNKEAREKMHLAATLAGLAIGNSAPALTHSMDQIGPIFNIPHGRVLATLLPYIIQYNRKVSENEYVEIAQCIGIKSRNSRDSVNELIKGIKDLAKQLAMPITIGELGINKEDLEDKIDLMISEVSKAFATQQNPRIPTPEEIRKIFAYAYDGIEIDF